MNTSRSTWIPYDGFRGVGRLFSTYCSDYQQLSPFFAGDWRNRESFDGVASEVSKRRIDRTRLVEVLQHQNEGWGHFPPCRDLGKPDALAVVTGQQVGLFGGPLYTLYKAITAVKLARQLQQDLGRAVVPVFWLEGGDHDFDEVSSIALPFQGRVTRVQYEGHKQPAISNLGPVGAIEFSGDISRVVEELRTVLPVREGLPDVIDEFYHAYAEGQSFADAFARTLVRLVGNDLVIIDPEWPEIKRLAASFIRHTIRSHEAVYERLQASTASVASEFHAQINPRPCNFFVITDSGREAAVPEEGGFRLSVSGLQLSMAEMLGLPPERLSPNVVTRPLVQDFLLPTVAYVAGPSEVAYFAQFKALYQWAELPMPIVFPRASLTLIEPRIAKVMARFHLDVLAMQSDVPQLMRRVLLEGSRLEAAFAGAVNTLEECAAALQPEIEQIELTLGRSVEATRAKWLRDLQKLRRRVERAEKGRHEQVEIQLERCRNKLFPTNKMQERVFPALYYLSLYGDEFLTMLNDHISIDHTNSHQLLQIPG